MPEDGVSPLTHEDIMRYEDILFLCRALGDLGVRKIRFTGGEPLVRKGFVPFLKEFRASFPGIALSLTTNASLLRRHAYELAQTGLSGLNISLDTLDPEKFRSITRVGDISDVMDGIRAALASGIPNIKTNTVPMRGFNDADLPLILSFAWENGLLPRLIEFMPIDDDVWRRKMFVGEDEILAALSRRFGAWTQLGPDSSSAAHPQGPARYYRDAGGRTVGVIAAVSNHFCQSCNRLRVTASGQLRACLFSRREMPLLGLIRSGDYDGLGRAILEGMSAKPQRWEQERSGALQMSNIGG
jgi:cyclic pyranopterin phosphate synthase